MNNHKPAKDGARSALILVDIQNDFVPGGALAVQGGDEVAPIANACMGEYDLVVATQDWHPSGHLSFASQHATKSVGDLVEVDGLSQILWPDHCVQGSFGAEFLKSLNQDGIDRVFQKGTLPNRDSYSGFFDNGGQHATGLGDFLKEQNVATTHVMGLATDYCVKFTALDSARLGFETHLILTGCRGVELQTGDIAQAIDEMRSAGILVEEGTH